MGQRFFILCYNILQHFTTFTLPRKLTKPVYRRPALSPLDFLRFGLQRPKCLKIFHAVFASLYGFAALVDWRFGTLQNACPDTAAFSGCCERGLPDSPCVQCHFGGESGRHSATRSSSVHSSGLIILQSVVTRYLFVQKVVNCCYIQ